MPTCYKTPFPLPYSLVHFWAILLCCFTRSGPLVSSICALFFLPWLGYPLFHIVSHCSLQRTPSLLIAPDPTSGPERKKQARHFTHGSSLIPALFLPPTSQISIIIIRTHPSNKDFPCDQRPVLRTLLARRHLISFFSYVTGICCRYLEVRLMGGCRILWKMGEFRKPFLYFKEKTIDDFQTCGHFGRLFLGSR